MSRDQNNSFSDREVCPWYPKLQRSSPSQEYDTASRDITSDENCWHDDVDVSLVNFLYQKQMEE